MELSESKKKPTYIPLIVGVIFTILFFIPLSTGDVFDQISGIRGSNRFYILAFHLILRAFLAFWTFRLVTQYELKGKYLWALLTFITVGIGLIAINIAILLKLKSTD